MRSTQKENCMDFSDNGQKSTQSVNTKTVSFTGVQSRVNSTALTASATAGATAKSAGAEYSGHKLELDHERAMSMTGVKDVPVFTDKNITVRLANETLLVTGQNLAVKNLDVESGKLQVTGRVFSLRYTSQTAPTSFIKRIFK